MRAVIGGLVLVLVLGIALVKTGDEVSASCVEATVSTPLTSRAVDGAEAWGKAFARFTDGEVTKLDVVRGIDAVWERVTLVFKAFRQPANGQPTDSAVTGWRARVKDKQAKALAACCPTAPPPPDTPDVAPKEPEAPDDWDPKLAAFRRTESGYTKEQTEIAATAIAVGKAKDIPERGWVVALAAGFVESGLRNLNYGDRDSIGWLQQRPSAGWGSRSQIMDPKYAAAKFYSALVRVEGWQTMPVGRAAQRVQISAFPDRYAKWEDEARDLVGKLSGGTPAAPLSTPNLDCEARTPLGDDTAEKLTGGGPTPAVFDQQGNPRTVEQAMAWLTRQERTKAPITVNMCSHYVANAYGWPNSGSPTALSLWSHIPSSLKHPGTSMPPRGALVWWRTGAAPGHIAISMGNGMIASTDVPRGRWGIVPIAKIDAWGSRVGWSTPRWPAHSRGTQA